MPIRTLYTSVLILLCLVGGANSQSAPTAAAASAVYTGIVVDCSGSQRLQMDRVVSVIKQFAEAMQDGDQAFVVRFVDPARTSVVQDLTREKSDLNDAAEGLYVEGGQTSLFDAVDYAARYFAKNKAAASGGSSALILISSGEDKADTKSIDETLSLLKGQQLRVYAIGLSDLKVTTKLLDRLTRDTGGKTFVPRTTAELSNAVLDIAKSMRGVIPAK
ncbi:MAG TPA: VWA domain-containing protein [Pyrinomonadaceae bacterium]|nr:VWA domain-containing protein [Pyrinomonadaceae bacterium]